MNDGQVQIVVLGGGFGGLTFCQHFEHAKADVTLVDRTNHHLFQPLLYQVAMAGLSPANIAVPIRSVLHNQKNTDVMMAEVRGFDLAKRTVHTSRTGDLPYDSI